MHFEHRARLRDEFVENLLACVTSQIECNAALVAGLGIPGEPAPARTIAEPSPSATSMRITSIPRSASKCPVAVSRWAPLCQIEQAVTIEQHESRIVLPKHPETADREQNGPNLAAALPDPAHRVSRWITPGKCKIRT